MQPPRMNRTLFAALAVALPVDLNAVIPQERA